MLVVDTNVVASLLLKGPLSEPALALYQADPDWRSEAFLMTELANVLATQIKLRDLPLADALDLLSRSDALMADGLVEISHGAALTLAAQLGVSAYDARYLVVTQRLQTRLITEDAKLRSKAPGPHVLDRRSDGGLVCHPGLNVAGVRPSLSTLRPPPDARARRRSRSAPGR